MIDRVRFGDPIGVQGIDGFSNVTDIANAVSYLTLMVESTQRSGTSFHHLAEFSAIPWRFWLERIAAVLGTGLFELKERPAYGTGMTDDFRWARATLSPRPLLGQLWRGRVTGSWLRSVAAVSPRWALRRIQIPGSKLALEVPIGRDTTDVNLLTILTTKRQFPNRLDPTWEQPVNLEESWSAVNQWMNEAGYFD
jgi:hypothetical protein